MRLRVGGIIPYTPRYYTCKFCGRNFKKKKRLSDTKYPVFCEKFCYMSFRKSTLMRDFEICYGYVYKLIPETENMLELAVQHNINAKNKQTNKRKNYLAGFKRSGFCGEVQKRSKKEVGFERGLILRKKKRKQLNSVKRNAT